MPALPLPNWLCPQNVPVLGAYDMFLAVRRLTSANPAASDLNGWGLGRLRDSEQLV